MGRPLNLPGALTASRAWLADAQHRPTMRSTNYVSLARVNALQYRQVTQRRIEQEKKGGAA